MPQISVYLHSQEGNYIIKLFTKTNKCWHQVIACDRMRYVLKHNDKKIFFSYVVMLMRLLLQLRWLFRSFTLHTRKHTFTSLCCCAPGVNHHATRTYIIVRITIVFQSLSDPCDKDYQPACDHTHQDTCHHCEELTAVLHKIDEGIQRMFCNNVSEDTREELFLYLISPNRTSLHGRHIY